MRRQTVGIIGGGQLGRMLIQAGLNYPVSFHVYSNSEDFPAKPCCSSYTVGDLNDYNKIVKFGQACDILTIEIENVNTDALKCLRDRYNKRVYPHPEILMIIKDRFRQKIFLNELDGVDTMPFVLCAEPYDYQRLMDDNKITYPYVNKIQVGGYDGYGTKIIKTPDDLPYDKPSIVEEFCDFDRELSVQVARNSHGQIVVLPVVEMKFTQNNMLDYLVCPFDDDSLVEKIRDVAYRIVNELKYVGLLAIELFQKGEDIWVNEMAPRPHNSGHHTQDMFSQSQFELLVRCLLGLPLTQPRMNSKCGASINLLGHIPANHTPDQPVYMNINEILELEDVYVHMYDKAVVKQNRKMGHINILANDRTELESKIKQVKDLLEESVVPEINQGKKIKSPMVGVIMGSKSDMPVMMNAIDVLREFGVPVEVKIVSAHRTPEMMLEYGKRAEERGMRVIIAGAGGAAHLPGMVASCTNLPVIGVPVKSSNSIDGWDSMLSILQMPGGVPVATVGLDNSKNAGLLAAKILGLNDKMERYRDGLKARVEQMNRDIGA